MILKSAAHSNAICQLVFFSLKSAWQFLVSELTYSKEDLCVFFALDQESNFHTPSGSREVMYKCALLVAKYSGIKRV